VMRVTAGGGWLPEGEWGEVVAGGGGTWLRLDGG